VRYKKGSKRIYAFTSKVQGTELNHHTVPVTHTHSYEIIHTRHTLSQRLLRAPQQCVCVIYVSVCFE